MKKQFLFTVLMLVSLIAPITPLQGGVVKKAVKGTWQIVKIGGGFS